MRKDFPELQKAAQGQDLVDYINALASHLGIKKFYPVHSILLSLLSLSSLSPTPLYLFPLLILAHSFERGVEKWLH